MDSLAPRQAIAEQGLNPVHLRTTEEGLEAPRRLR